MTFKEKHLHQAFGALAVSMAMLVPTGCTNQKSNDDSEQEQQVGLLDPTPIKAADKFNNNVTLYLVNVPVYNKNGTPKTDHYVLTHGINNSSYRPMEAETYICKAYFNGSKTWHYVKTDKNRAIYTENGFSGLFVDKDGEAVIVADSNVADFVKELEVQHIANKKRDNVNVRDNIKPAEVALKDTTVVKAENPDSVSVEIMPLPKDTTKVERITPEINPLDTLMKQQEIRE